MQIQGSIILAALVQLSSACPLHSSGQPNASPQDLIRRSVPASFSKTAITDVRVFNGTSFTPPQTVIIHGDKITNDCNDIATTINATGLYLIPGLIDSHVHIFNVQGLENMTSFGVTTSMNMACQNYTICNALKGHPGLTDFKTAGMPAVGPDSEHAKWQHLQSWQLVTDASNATDLVTWAKTNGSDYYKITLEPNGPSYNLTSRLISAAHDFGIQTMSHASDLAAYAQAIETGIDGIQHVPRNGNLTDAQVQQMKNSQKTFVTPTLAIFAASLNPPNPAVLGFLGVSPGPTTASWTNVIYNARAIYRAGIPFLAGTDAVGPISPNVTIPFGDTLHRELGYFVNDVGMTPAEAINAATKVAAQYHRLNDRGVIQEGMRADLLLLGSDPLQNINNTRDIVSIWVGGRKYPGNPAV